ncbi:hypothetical protein [Aeoliella sp. SH292]|uniref:hypothetical protein n=1 Tax=Aeoliella sp. SH292 TaxID=3454464 RepID=UPI003F9A01A6
MLSRLHYSILCIALALAGYAQAADDSTKFLEAMRARGMFDLALDYLNDAQGDRLVSDEFKKQIPYERGVTLLDKWRVTPSASERDRLADQIKGELANYAAANVGTPRTADAQQQLATLLNEQATRALTVLENRPGASENEGQIKGEARGQLAEARKLYGEVEKSLESQLEKFPKALDPKTQSGEIDRRREMRARLSQVRVLKAQTLLEESKTVAKDSGDFKKLNEQAVKDFQDLYDKYGSFIVGFYARVYQGEAYLALGKNKEAMACFEDIVVQGGDNPGTRALVTKALALQAQLMLADGDAKGLLDKQGKWLVTGRGGELRTPDWLTLKFVVAEAKRKQAAAAETKDADKRKLMEEARTHYFDVAQLQGRYQNDARQILSSEFASAKAGPERQQVKTFDEAIQAAKDAINSWNAARQTIPAAKENNPEGVAALEEQAAKGFGDALYYLNIASTLVDDETPVEKVNESRWLSCWLMWQDEQFYRSAVLASFLARRYPEDPTASGAAQVALASYDKLYQQAVKDGGPDAGAAEADKLKELSSFITRRWGGTALADTAFGVLLNFSIKDKQFDVALDLVNQLPEDQRPVFQAKIANTMWEAQLRAAIEKDTSFDRDGVRTKAIELLAASYPALVADAAATDTLAPAALYLAQARLEAGDYAEAIKLLEDPKAGPLALVKTNNPIASRQAYGMEAYKAALRAYVSVVPPQTDKAVATMAELEKIVGEGDADKLTRVYLSLGVQLQQQIEDLQSAGKIEEAKRVSEAFVAFLDKLNERGSSDPTVRQWIAQTYFRLAEGLKGDANAAQLRESYYDKAAQSFKQILDDPNAGIDANRKLGLQLQYAETLRHAGKFAEAMQIFEIILAEKEMMIEAQTAAAYTLQEWGSKDASKFAYAIGGTGPLNDKGKPIVWGWNYLGKVAVSVAKSRPEMQARFKELFYECWLNIATISVLKAEGGDPKKDALLKQARKIIADMVKNYPDLLTMPIREQYNELMKSIQRAENSRAVGLEEILEEKKS